VCDDIEAMIGCLISLQYPDAELCNWTKDERKKRLFVAACLRRIWTALPAEYRSLEEPWSRARMGTCPMR
jgi:hypothetical protein